MFQTQMGSFWNKGLIYLKLYLHVQLECIIINYTLGYKNE